MIKVQEITPLKFSGRSSFLVNFDYKPKIVEAIKLLPNYYYHKKTYSWEVPINCLKDLLDSLVQIDSIDLMLKNEIETISNTNLTDEEISKFKIKPFQHQVEAVNFGLKHKGWLLLDSMGVGKTAEVIYYAEALKRRGLIDHALIICGVDSLRQNWKNEIKTFSNFTVRVLGENLTKTGRITYTSISERLHELMEPINEFFVVMNAATLRDDRIIEALKSKKCPNKFGLIAVDECHRFSRRQSNQTSNLLKLEANYKVGASGTLIINDCISAYCPLYFTGNDHATLTNFKAQYCEFGGFGGREVIGYKNLEILKDELDHCSIRRTFKDVRGDMPTKTIDYELVELDDRHRKFYDAIKNGVKEEADKIELNTNNLLALTTRLRQATSCPTVLTTENIKSSKLERAVEIAEDLLESGEKVIIMSHFKESVNVLKDALSKYSPLLGTGDQSEIETQKNVDDFRFTDKNLLIGTAQKIGTGFSMPECHYMILVDMPFTASLLSQETDRIFRITSKDPVYIKILLCKDTIDEHVKEIVDDKQDLSDYIVDDKLSDKLANKLRDIITKL